MSTTMTVEPTTVQLPKLKKSREANWPAVLFFIHIHLLSLYGLWLLLFEAKLLTILLLAFLSSVAILGVTIGSHRLWAHKTYKASTKLRIVLMLFQTLAGHGSIYDWVQNHRFHHAYYKTDADPYDSRKGFVYAHFLTRLQKLSEYQESFKNTIDMSDIEKDSVVMFQKRFYWVMYAVLFILLPINAPLEYWNDTILSAVFIIGFVRYAIVLHGSWLLESGVCLWGLKEGEKYPPDTNLVFILSKTYWPEYHYIYPCDYKSGEYGTYGSGCSTAFIRVFAALGEATNLCTLETNTLHKALAVAARTKKPLAACIESAICQQALEKDHFLKS
ncbi:acyl-CoA Delta-9 desaturase [Maniola hyperantus]|uniref:acyl-CoA Delta-9 desaturase n=1 Tax=Aphantopus hyperantus TaxID=2795564 RepID=UPI001568B25B|nr:acyl-CoA Delta(11) desaturase [Maniola hyperantus]